MNGSSFGAFFDFLLSEHRDIAAAKRFFKKAIGSHGTPEKITLDGYAVTRKAVQGLKESATLPTNDGGTPYASSHAALLA
jgi:putative transposase